MRNEQDVIADIHELTNYALPTWRVREVIDYFAHMNKKKLSKGEVFYLRRLHKEGHDQDDLAEIFDINPATVSRIVRGIYHKDV